MRNIVIGTAGHIDHGKSALVKALTGTDPDRLKEEKERGITIDLGFANLDLGGGLHAGIVDVPGHERFVKNMVAGTGGIDLVMLVVAADEGVMPQTREHLDICRLLGVERGVVALNKVDLVSDPGWLEAVSEDLQRELAGTFLEQAPVVSVSSKTGVGLPELVAALGQVGATVPPRLEDAPPFLAIDRAFSIHGFGTVVTGTLVSGTLRVESTVDVLPDATGHLRALKIRGLQCHGKNVDRVAAGQRVAVNLSGVERSALSRGQVLVEVDSLAAGQELECSLALVSGAPPLRTRMRILFHTGTTKTSARLRLVGTDALAAGSTGFARIRCQVPVAALPGQHFILRGFNPIPGRGTTLGGGQILAIHPPRRRRAQIDRWIEELSLLSQGSIEEKLLVILGHLGTQGATLSALCVRTGLGRKAVAKELQQLFTDRKAFLFDREHGRVVGASTMEELRQEATARLARFHSENPLLPGMPSEELRSRLAPGMDPRLFRLLIDELVRRKEVVGQGEGVRLSDHRVQLGERGSQLEQSLQRIFSSAALAPPRLEQAAQELGRSLPEVQELVQHLTRIGFLTHISADMYVPTSALDDLRMRLRAYLSRHGEISTQDFKALVGASRKHAIPLAEFFDREKITMRVGEKRVARNK